jgi:hypothetical protein
MDSCGHSGDLIIRCTNALISFDVGVTFDAMCGIQCFSTDNVIPQVDTYTAPLLRQLQFPYTYWYSVHNLFVYVVG